MKVYSIEENQQLLEELNNRNGYLGEGDFEAMANVWGGLFGVERTKEALSFQAAKLFKERHMVYRVWTPPRKNKRVTTRATETKIGSDGLRRLLCQAKQIKQQTDAFCRIVEEFAEEYERDRHIMKQLAKLRRAVEETKLEL